ncbi:MAG: VOC family protein [Pseudomonadota bacterium]|nr:VOC family protein [Pseudomonadota bacterium]
MNEGTSAMTPPQLGALEISCLRFPAMVAWYRDLLGAEVEYRDAMHAWLRAPAGWHLVLTASAFEPRPRECAGVPGPAFEYADASALAGAFHAFRQRGIYPERAAKNGWVTSLLYRDPDGNPVAMRCMVPPEQRAAAPLNPLGDEFDPAALFG